MSYQIDASRMLAATDALARLTGRLDASIEVPSCAMSLEDVRTELVAARRELFAALHDGHYPSWRPKS